MPYGSTYIRRLYIMKKILFAIATCTLISSPALAAVKGNSNFTKVIKSKSGTINNPQGLWFFVGANSGWISRDTNVQNETYADGMQLTLKGIGSYYFADKKWILDTGLGLQKNLISRNGQDLDSLGIQIDINPRYRLNKHWQIGPSYTAVLGDNVDVKNNDSNSDINLIGASFMYEFPYDNTYPVRVGARISSDFDVSERDINVAMFEVQIGWPQKQQKKNTQVISSNNKRTNINLNDYDLNYGVGKVAPNSKVQRFLTEIAKELSKRPNLANQIIVIGQTDSLGSNQTNRILSQARAQEALRIMTEQGVSAEQILTKTKTNPKTGENNPNNRRLDIRFNQVNDKAELAKIIEKAASKSGISKN